MTVELLEEEATDAEELIIAWLTPLGPTAFQRRAGDPKPQRLVRRVAGAEDECESLDTAVVSVHTFCDAADPDAALVECKRTHQRMLYLARYLPDVPLLDGRIASVEWLEVAEKPIWVDYQDDSILRKVGRYQFGLTIATAV